MPWALRGVVLVWARLVMMSRSGISLDFSLCQCRGKLDTRGDVVNVWPDMVG